MSEENEGQYGLVMPFICCESNGGHLDDEAFVRGAQFGQVDAILKMKRALGDPGDYEVYVDPKMLPQFDLLAMHHGYKLTSTPWEEHPDEWTRACFEMQPMGVA